MPRWMLVSILAGGDGIIGIFCLPESAQVWRIVILLLIALAEGALIGVWFSHNRGVRLQLFEHKSGIATTTLIAYAVIWIAAIVSTIPLVGTPWVLLIVFGAFAITTTIVLALYAHALKQHTGVADR